MNDDFVTLFAFDRWADRRLIEAVRQLTPTQYAEPAAPGCPSVHEILVHLGDAADIWARRLAGETVTGRTSPDDLPTRDAAVTALEETHARLEQLLPTLDLTPERLAAPFSYVNLRGEPHALPLWALLRHLVNHSSYHRGQIAVHLLRFGIEPPLLDLALWAEIPDAA